MGGIVHKHDTLLYQLISYPRDNIKVSMEQQETVSLKLLFLGDSGTGKSSILLRFCDDEFFGDEAATIGN